MPRIRLSYGVVAALVLAACSPFSLPGSVPVPAQLGVAPQSSACLSLNPQKHSLFEVLAINNKGHLAGWDGRHGFLIYAPYKTRDFSEVDFPHAKDTVITAVSEDQTIAGYYEAASGKLSSFVRWKGIWTDYIGRNHHAVAFLAENRHGIIVGYITAGLSDKAFELDGKTFRRLHPPGAVSSQATGVNEAGTVIGDAVLGNGDTVGFVLRDGKFHEFSDPEALGSTHFAAINDHDRIVGAFAARGGAVHGFELADPLQKPQWTTFDFPKARGLTQLTGINDSHQLAGFYQTGPGEISGFVCP